MNIGKYQYNDIDKFYIEKSIHKKALMPFSTRPQEIGKHMKK